MGFSRPEQWSELPFPSLGDLPHAGMEPGSPALQVDSLPSEPPGKPLFKLAVVKCIIRSCQFVCGGLFLVATIPVDTAFYSSYLCFFCFF